jgi:hypothetical protein
MRHRLWWPSNREHATAGGVVLVIVATLGILGVPKFIAFPEFFAIKGTGWWCLAAAMLLLILNSCLFFMIGRVDYLKIHNGLRPLFISFILLSATFFIVWTGSRTFVRGASLGLFWPIPWRSVAKATYVSQAGLTMAFLCERLGLRHSTSRSPQINRQRYF